MDFNGQKNKGVSLTEVLIIMAIVALFLIIGFMVFTTQIGKGRDAKRREDLHRIRNAFEEYYNDNGCYPSFDILADCGSDSLAPYLSQIPCDPESKTPYLYVVDSSTCPSWHYVFSEIEYKENLTNECRDGCNFEGIDSTYYYYVYGGAPPNPWELDDFIGFGDSEEDEIVDCPHYLGSDGCFELDLECVRQGRDDCCNDKSGRYCAYSADCYTNPGCSDGNEIECCYGFDED